MEVELHIVCNERQEEEEKVCFQNALPHCKDGTITTSGGREVNFGLNGGKDERRTENTHPAANIDVRIIYVKSKELGQVVVSGSRHCRASTRLQVDG